MNRSKTRSLIDFWSCPPEQLWQELSCSERGLTTAEATARQKIEQSSSLAAPHGSSSLLLFLLQFKSPVTLILIAAAILSFFLGERSDTFIILAIIVVSAALGYYQEKGGCLRSGPPDANGTSESDGHKGWAGEKHSRAGSRCWRYWLGVVVITLWMPFLPFARLMGFTRLPLPFYCYLALIVLCYMAAAETAKRFFYRSKPASISS